MCRYQQQFQEQSGRDFPGLRQPYTLPKESPATRKCVPLIANGALASPQLPGTCSNLWGNANSSQTRLPAR
jgi:hypothetical protein